MGGNFVVDAVDKNGVKNSEHKYLKTILFFTFYNNFPIKFLLIRSNNTKNRFNS